ncbi:MAG: hypothetical protein ACJAUR_001818 [Ulvibacter sp.]|jgi:hypothetical protein
MMMSCTYLRLYISMIKRLGASIKPFSEQKQPLIEISFFMFHEKIYL